MRTEECDVGQFISILDRFPKNQTPHDDIPPPPRFFPAAPSPPWTLSPGPGGGGASWAQGRRGPIGRRGVSVTPKGLGGSTGPSPAAFPMSSLTSHDFPDHPGARRRKQQQHRRGRPWAGGGRVSDSTTQISSATLWGGGSVGWLIGDPPR